MAQQASPPMPAINSHYQMLFNSVDTNKSGQLSANELQQIFRETYYVFSLETCYMLIGMLDMDRSKQINIYEFQTLMDVFNAWKVVFQTFDTDRSGLIETHELERAFQALNYPMSPSLLAAIIRYYDLDGEQRFTLESFMRACISIQTLSWEFERRKTDMDATIDVAYEEFLSICLQVK